MGIWRLMDDGAQQRYGREADAIDIRVPVPNGVGNSPSSSLTSLFSARLRSRQKTQSPKLRLRREGGAGSSRHILAWQQDEKSAKASIKGALKLAIKYGASTCCWLRLGGSAAALPGRGRSRNCQHVSISSRGRRGRWRQGWSRGEPQRDA